MNQLPRQAWAGVSDDVRRAATRLLVDMAYGRQRVSVYSGATSTGLTHPLLARSSGLSAAASNAPALRSGARGEAVQRLQLALVQLGFPLPNSTKEQSTLPDGIFGGETLNAVRAFQRSQGLVVDGVVGKNTLAAMDRLLPAPVPSGPPCTTCRHGHDPVFVDRLRRAFISVNPVSNVKVAGEVTIGLTPPTGARFLTPAQRAAATAVFGGSLDFSRIFLTNALGLGGAPFTAAIPISTTVPGGPGVYAIALNVGTFSPPTDLLVHELAHAWQSQHSIAPVSFMSNSVASQGLAETLKAFGTDASAYYYKPGKSFGAYAAEQIACQVESRVPAILTVIRSPPPHVPHPANELSLSVPRWEVRSPGVVTTC